MDPLDDKVKAALQAFEAVASPRGYFDELSAKIEARLEGEVPMQSDGTPRTENTGLHDIQAMARSTRQRISRRQTSQHDIDESVLSSSQSGMHAIALPDPAKMIGLPSPEEARALSASMSMRAADAAAEPGAPAAAREPVGLGAYAVPAAQTTTKKGGVPVWLWAGGGLAAAAAAVAAFVMIGNSDDAKKSDRGEATVAMEQSAGSAADPEPEKKAEQDTVTVTGLADATGAAGMASGSAMGSADAVITPIEAADTEKPSDSRDDDKVSAKSKERKKDDGNKDKAPPPSDSKGSGSAAGSGSGSASGSSKGSAKKTGGGAGSGTTNSAVLGEGDSDELGIGDAIKGGGGDEDKPKKTELTSKELRAGLDAVAGKAKSCYDGAVGTVKVKLTVSPSGSVSKASASGDLAGTPSADCVVAAIKGATFPAWTGAPMSTTYAVLLSD